MKIKPIDNGQYKDSLDEHNFFFNNNKDSHQKESITLKIHQDYALKMVEENYKIGLNSLCNYSVGTGKTYIACKILETFIKNVSNPKHYALVFCPTNEIRDDTWATHFSRLNLQHKVLDKDNIFPQMHRENTEFTPIPNCKIYIITYTLFSKKDSSTDIPYSEFFINNPPEVIIFDEIHRLSNNALKESDGKLAINKTQTNPILKLKAEFKLGLTGTEIVNKKNEILALFKILNTDKRTTLKNLAFFVIPYQTEILNTTSSLIFYEPEEDQKQNLKKIDATSMDAMSKRHKLELETYVKRNDKKAIKEIPIEYILDNIDAKNDSDKIIILAKDTEYLANLYNFECIKKRRPIKLYGSGMNVETRKNNLNLFKNNNEFRILLATKDIASEGLNLEIANQIIICGLSWNPKEIIQSIGRINRLTQQKNTHSYILAEMYKILDNCEDKVFTWNEFKQQIIKTKNLENYFPSPVKYYIKQLINKNDIYLNENINNINPKVFFLDSIEDEPWRDACFYRNLILKNNIDASKITSTTQYYKSVLIDRIELLKKQLFIFKFDFSDLDIILDSLKLINKDNDNINFILFRLIKIIENLYFSLHYLNMIHQLSLLIKYYIPKDQNKIIRLFVHNEENRMKVYSSEQLFKYYKEIQEKWFLIFNNSQNLYSKNAIQVLINKIKKEYALFQLKLVNLTRDIKTIYDSYTLNNLRKHTNYDQELKNLNSIYVPISILNQQLLNIIKEK